MIRTEKEYLRSLAVVRDGEKALEAQRKELVKNNVSADRIKREQDPTRIFLDDIKDELKWYENAKEGKFSEINDLETIGRTLVALRIASGITQVELAKKLEIGQANISRDENEEYHGITLERAQRIMSVFGAKLRSKVLFIPHNRRRAA